MLRAETYHCFKGGNVLLFYGRKRVIVLWAETGHCFRGGNESLFSGRKRVIVLGAETYHCLGADSIYPLMTPGTDTVCMETYGNVNSSQKVNPFQRVR